RDAVSGHAQALRFPGPSGRSPGEPEAGLIDFGARLVERAAQLLEPALEQQGPVRAGWRASTRGRYAFSQGKRTIRHYNEMREFAKPGRSVPHRPYGPRGGFPTTCSSDLPSSCRMAIAASGRTAHGNGHGIR